VISSPSSCSVSSLRPFLSPAVVDGGTFGPFDYDTTLTLLGSGLYPAVHNLSNGDAVSQMISWNALDWRMIHAGHFPLWNDYSGLGMPEFLNFESGVLSFPTSSATSRRCARRSSSRCS